MTSRGNLFQNIQNLKKNTNAFAIHENLSLSCIEFLYGLPADFINLRVNLSFNINIYINCEVDIHSN